MHNLESGPENKMQKNSLGFRDTKDSSNLGQTTRPSDSKKKNFPISGFCRSSWTQGKAKGKERDKYLDLNEKNMVHEIDGDTNCNWCSKPSVLLAIMYFQDNNNKKCHWYQL